MRPFPLIFMLCAACAASQVGDAWWGEVEAADRLADDDPAAAERVYHDMIERAPTESQRRYVVFRLGELAEEQGRYDEAVETYLSLLQNRDIYDADDDHTPNALFRVGLLLYDELDRRDDALAVWRQVVHYYPDAEGPVHRALDGIVRHHEERGLDQELVAWLASEFAPLKDTRVGDNILYWWAYWLRHHLDRPEEALELFLILREHYYDASTLRDDADWEIVELLHELGQYEREVHFLDRMRREREENIIFGPLVTAQMEDAAFRLGVVRLENLNDPEGAIRAFEEFLDTWRYSLKRDDAAYNVVRAAQRLGDHERTRRAAERFVEEFQESRHLDEVAQILADLGGGG